MLNGVVIGFFAALIGAGLWAVVMGVTHRELGIVAIAVGALVGLAMTRNASPHSALPFVAAVLALFAILLGTLLGDIALQANYEKIPLMDAVRLTFSDMGLLGDIFGGFFSPIDLLFWAVGVSGAYRFVSRAVAAAQLEQQQVAAAMASPNFGTPPASPALGTPAAQGPSPYASPVPPAEPAPQPEADPA